MINKKSSAPHIEKVIIEVRLYLDASIRKRACLCACACLRTFMRSPPPPPPPLSLSLCLCERVSVYVRACLRGLAHVCQAYTSSTLNICFAVYTIEPSSKTDTQLTCWTAAVVSSLLFQGKHQHHHRVGRRPVSTFKQFPHMYVSSVHIEDEL